MGHVPPGALPEARHRAELPGRQHRGTGAGGPPLGPDRDALGRLGESIVADRYRAWGYRVVASRLRVAGGEADLLVQRSRAVVVEVKTVAEGDPFLHVDEAKERVLNRIAAALGASRIDVVGVVAGVDVRLHAIHGW